MIILIDNLYKGDQENLLLFYYCTDLQNRAIIRVKHVMKWANDSVRKAVLCVYFFKSYFCFCVYYKLIAADLLLSDSSCHSIGMAALVILGEVWRVLVAIVHFASNVNWGVCR